MNVRIKTGMRTFARDLLIIFVVVLFLSVAFAGMNLFSYIAVGGATLIRNTMWPEVGSGTTFYLLAGGVLFLQALVIALVVQWVRRTLDRLLSRPRSPTR
ncbi:hypothetical protein [Haloarchaeobius sp. TZWWS8]|uniref:hypothetical protein n=1 Tax=Haloarchaeobius sp. TZWWS8 TaxID=3446121 RepID=UPI003EBB68E8